MPGIDDYERELHDAIEELVERGDLLKGSDEHGIAQYVISNGQSALTPKQRYVYATRVQPLVDSVFAQWRDNERANSEPK